MELKDRIYRAIKEVMGRTPPKILTIGDLAIILDKSPDIVYEEVMKQRELGFLKVSAHLPHDKYRAKVTIRIVLDPVAPTIDKYWNAALLPKPTEEIPQKYTNPTAKMLVHLHQGNRGTCVGYTGANMNNVSRATYLGEMPTPNQRESVLRDQLNKYGIIVDILPPDLCCSAESAYQNSREIYKQNGQDVPPSGSLVEYMCIAAKTIGFCREDYWNTSKSYYHIHYEPHDLRAQDDMDAQRIDGFARTYSFNEFCKGIYEYGCAPFSLVVWENCFSGIDLFTGKWPNPKGAIIGAHAVLAIGYDLEKKLIYFINTWEGYPMIQCIDLDYWLDGLKAAFVILDKEQASFMRNIYQNLLVEATHPAVIWIDEEYKGALPQTFELEKGREYVFRIKTLFDKEMTKTIKISEEDSAALKITITFTYQEAILWYLKQALKKIIEKLGSLFTKL